MKRDCIDFHKLAYRDEPMHERLLNWARYVSSVRGNATCAPMFRFYRSSETWADNTPRIPVDSLDGLRIEREVAKLPEKNCLAIRWQYVYSLRGVTVWKACRTLAVTQPALFDLVTDARHMLKNRLTYSIA